MGGCPDSRCTSSQINISNGYADLYTGSPSIIPALAGFNVDYSSRDWFFPDYFASLRGFGTYHNSPPQLHDYRLVSLLSCSHPMLPSVHCLYSFIFRSSLLVIACSL